MTSIYCEEIYCEEPDGNLVKVAAYSADP